MVSNIYEIVIILAVALILGEICKIIKLPRMLGHLFAGILIGFPLIKDSFFNAETLSILNSFAEIGLILLFFFVGLNINLKEFKSNIKESFLISSFNFLIPLAAGFLISKFILNFDTITSLIIGVTLSATSQAVAVNLLDELNVLKTRIGNLIVTSGAANDVFELILISGILAVLNLGKLFQGVYLALGNIAIFIVALMILRFAIFPYILGFFEKNKSDTSLFAGSILIAMITALLSNLLGLGIFIGALFSGIVIRQILLTGKHKKPWEEHVISKSIHTISFGFLVPIFFVVAGLKTDLNLILDNIGLSLVFLLIAFFGTIGGSVLGVILSNGSLKEGLIVGFGISSRGDVELVIATLALTSGLFNQEIFSAVVFMAFVTTLICPIMFRLLLNKYKNKINLKN